MFERELETYREIRDRLIGSGHEGRLAVIKGKFFAVLDTYEEAIRFGVDVFGPDEPFLVEPIRTVNPVEYHDRRIESADHREITPESSQ